VSEVPHLDSDEKGGSCCRAAERRLWKPARESAGFRGSCGTGPAGVSVSGAPAGRAQDLEHGYSKFEMIILTA